MSKREKIQISLAFVFGIVWLGWLLYLNINGILYDAGRGGFPR